MNILIYILASIGCVVCFLCVLLPLMEAITYGFGYTFFMWQFRDKDILKNNRFRSIFRWSMRPIRMAFRRIFGNERYVQSICIRGKTFTPFFKRIFSGE